MKTLAGDSTLINDQLIIELWTRRLPKLVQALVKSSGKTDVKDILVVADSVHETCQQQNMNVFSISNPSTSVPHSSVFELTLQNQKLQAEISEIKSMLSRLNLDDRQSNSRSRHRSQSRGRQNRSQSRNRDMCYYHRRFGNKANKCNEPCNFKKSPN